MSQPAETPALPLSSGIPSYLIPTGDHVPAGPLAGIENPDSLLDHDFNFQIVVFKVYFLSSNLHMKKR